MIPSLLPTLLHLLLLLALLLWLLPLVFTPLQRVLNQVASLLRLSDERPFSATFTELSVHVPEMNFWLSRVVLEVQKRNGEAYPLNTLYQLVCGLQRHLREHGPLTLKSLKILRSMMLGQLLTER